MPVEVNRYMDNLPINNSVTQSDSSNKGEWTNQLKECMDSKYTSKSQVLAAYTKKGSGEYVSGSYNEEPLIPPIINPPPYVTERGPNAPYYDEKLTGGPLIRPDARVYTYETAPSYIRAILDWMYGRPKSARNLPHDAEYSKVFYDLSSGNGFKGRFATDPDPDFIWEPGVNKKSSSSSRVLGAYTDHSYSTATNTATADTKNQMQRTFEDTINERQYQMMQWESALFDSIKEVIDAHPSQDAVVIDGDVVLLPKDREAPAFGTTTASVGSQEMSPAYFANAALLRQMRIDVPSDAADVYQAQQNQTLGTLPSVLM